MDRVPSDYLEVFIGDIATHMEGEPPPEVMRDIAEEFDKLPVYSPPVMSPPPAAINQSHHDIDLMWGTPNLVFLTPFIHTNDSTALELDLARSDWEATPPPHDVSPPPLLFNHSFFRLHSYSLSLPRLRHSKLPVLPKLQPALPYTKPKVTISLIETFEDFMPSPPRRKSAPAPAVRKPTYSGKGIAPYYRR